MAKMDTYWKFEGFLRELKEAFELSVAENIKETEGSSERYLIFLLDRESFALPIKQLREIILDKPIIPVPGASPSVHGVINHSNRILTVTNIHNLLQIPFKKAGNAYLLVTRDIKFKTGILVDGLVNLIAVNQTDIKPKISGQNKSIDRLVAGEIYYKERLVTLLDLTEVG